MSKYIGTPVVNVSVDTVDVTGDITTTDTTPEVIIVNNTHEDTDGGREGKVTFKGQQTGGEETTLAQIQASHDGTSDDEKGDLIFKTNDGSDGASPTEAMRIDSSQNVGIGTTSPLQPLHISYSNTDAIPTTALAGDTTGALQIFNTSNSSNYAGIFLRARETSSSNALIGLRYNTQFDDGDLFFRIRNGSGSNKEVLTLQSSGNVGIGTSSPQFDLHIHQNDSTNCLVQFTNSTTGSTSSDGLLVGLDSAEQAQVWFRENSPLRFATNDTEAMRINSSGELLIGTTDESVFNNSSGETGTHIRADGRIYNTTNNNTNIILNRFGGTGQNIQFRSNGSTVGEIGYTSSFYIADTAVGFRFDASGTDNILPCDEDGGLKDNAIDLGVNTTGRFDDIFATNGTIQTSDEREKQQIASLTDAEITAAKAISKLFKTFKWNDKVEAKGDAARIHTGVIAQQVETAMSDAGLNAGNYAFFISTTWWETQTEVAAVEADEENGIEAKAAKTRIDVYDTLEEAPEGATERNRKGIRYPELLSFIGAATEQRLTSIEARLDALEGE